MVLETRSCVFSIKYFNLFFGCCPIQSETLAKASDTQLVAVHEFPIFKREIINPQFMWCLFLISQGKALRSKVNLN